jgi:hypothetical protein
MFDTGCGHDLIAKTKIRKFEHLTTDISPITFNTAGGPSKTTLAIPMTISALISVLDSTPSVFSVGKRCKDKGYSFIWLSGMCPCLVAPNQKIIPLDVVKDIPYLTEEGLHTMGLEPSDLARLCGVCLTGHGIVVCPDGIIPDHVDLEDPIEKEEGHNPQTAAAQAQTESGSEAPSCGSEGFIAQQGSETSTGKEDAGEHVTTEGEGEPSQEQQDEPRCRHHFEHDAMYDLPHRCTVRRHRGVNRRPLQKCKRCKWWFCDICYDDANNKCQRCSALDIPSKGDMGA